MELENKSGKTNKPEPANKPEKTILLSRACAVIMIILYAGVLLRYDIKEDAGEFPVYGLASICSIMAGGILVSGLKNYKKGKWKKGIVQAIAVVFLMVAGRSWNLIGTAPHIMMEWLVLFFKYVLALFWPIWTLAAMKISGYGVGKDKRSDVFSVSLLYTLLTIFGLWFLEDVMVLQEWEDVDWMMTEVVMLSGFSCLVFFREYIQRLEGAGHKALAAVTMAAVYLAGLGLLIFKSPRLRVILYSLGIRLIDADGSLKNVNWLSYRLEAAKANWSGHLEPGFNRLGHNLMEGEVWLTWKRNPLSCLNAEYGKVALIVFLILFVGMLFYARRISYSNHRLERIAWYIRAEFIMIFVFSTLNELFLIRTGLGMGNYFPLLGYGVQMFPLLSLLYHLDELGEMEEKTAQYTGGIRLQELRWKKIYTYVTVLLLLPVLFWRIYNSPFEMDSYASADAQTVLIPEEIYTYQVWEVGDVSYVGMQKQGKMEGFGSERREGQFFFGYHTSGKRDGYGLLKTKDGSSWMGRYEDGTMREGLWIYEDGSWEMAGQPSDRNMESDNLKVIQYEYGDYYYGDVEDGKPEGYGQYYSPVQEYFYLGEFRNGIRDGTGAWYTTTSPEDLSMRTGTWDNGLYSGKGIWVQNPENGFEEGEWHHEEGTSYISLLKDGSWFYRDSLKPCGTHIIYRSDGNWYYHDMGR